MIRDHSTFVEVKPDSEKKYNEILHEAIGNTIFNNSCFSVSTHQVPIRSGKTPVLNYLLVVFHRPKDSKELVHLPMEFL